MGLQRVLRWAILPGVVVHELAHALVVMVLPNVEITEVDFTSHVKHRGRYTVLSSVLIAYAPLFVNTAVALLALSYVNSIVFSSVQSIGTGLLLAYIAFAAGMAAIPSWTDVASPLAVSRKQLFSLKGVLLLPFVLVLLVVSVPFLLIAYSRKRSFVLYVGLAVLYVAGIAVIGLGVVELPPFENVAENAWNAAERLVQELR